MKKIKIEKLIEIIKMKDEGRLIKTLFRKGFFHILSSNLFSQLLAFVTSILIIRLTSKSEYAYFSYANNLYSYIILIAGFGLSSALLKYCSSTNDSKKDKSYLMFALGYGTAIQLFLSIILVVVIYFVKIPFENAKELIYYMIFIPSLTYIYQVILNYYRSREENKKYSLLTISNAIIALILTYVLLKTNGIIGTALAKTISFFIMILIPSIFLFKNLRPLKRVVLDKKVKKNFVLMGLSIVISTFFYSIVYSNEIFLVNNLIGNEIITSNYKVALLIPSQLVIVTSSIMIYFFPIIAKTKDNKKIITLTKKIHLFSNLIIFIITFIGIIISPFIIKTIYGNQYSDAISLMTRFWFVYAINNSLIVSNNILLALGRTKVVMYVSIIISVIHFIIDYTLIKLFNVNGVAFATIFINLLGVIIFWIYLKRVAEKKESLNISI